METRELVHTWFQKWDKGDFKNIPVSDDFIHTSPYGRIEGKRTYLDLVESNKDKFLGNEITIHDELYRDKNACVRYTIINKIVGFTMEVSEWFYVKNDLISEIIAYYNIDGEISKERRLKKPD